MTPRSSGLDGLFIGSHALSEGRLSRHQLRSGVFRRVLHGVYADPALELDHAVVARAASLLMPEGAAIGGASAAWWHGGPMPEVTALVTVVLPLEATWRGPRGVRVHRTALSAAEIVDKDGVPCTDVLRTAWDVCALESPRTAVAALDAMLRSGTLRRGELEAMVRDGTGRWGAARVRRAAEMADPRSESPPESWLRVAFVQRGLPVCVPQFEVVENGVFLGRVDFAWPEARLIVEYEGAYHFDGLQIRRDDERYARLIAAGWRVIRVSAPDLRDLESLTARIAAALQDGPAAA